MQEYYLYGDALTAVVQRARRVAIGAGVGGVVWSLLVVYLCLLLVVLYLKEAGEMNRGAGSSSKGLTSSDSSYNRLFKPITRQVLLEIR